MPAESSVVGLGADPDLLNDPRLTRKQQGIAWYLCFWVLDGEDTFDGPWRIISGEQGITPVEVRRAVRRLAEIGLVEVIPRPPHSPLIVLTWRRAALAGKGA